MDGEALLAATKMFTMDQLLDHAKDEATPRVEWALIHMGLCRPREEYVSAIASTNHRESLCFVTGDPLVRQPKHTKCCPDCLNGAERLM